ncbi:DUF2157 domain-containing protein [Chitinimonas lacunae]|uniref:DUF2157 domain-containing protein n=1 Tax=Chitinimonas lacunae TaxID=1963018 RepID=A0ABV8MLY5_9NEIS
MKIGRQDLDAAAQAAVISPEQAQALWQFLGEHHANTPQFRFAHVLYYLGGMIAIAAMSLFMTVGWDTWGPLSLVVFSVCYGFVAWRLGVWLLERKRLPIPAGIMLVLAIVLVPLAIYGIQAWLDYWPESDTFDNYHRYIDYRWVVMEVGTLLVASVMLWRYKLPFMVMPVAVTLWYLGMDLSDGMVVDGVLDKWTVRQWFSLWYGLAMLVLAVYVDLRSAARRADYAFWLYLFGLMTFWGGLTSMESDSELGKFLYAMLNFGLIMIGAVLSRRAFAVFGAFGVALYLGHLAYTLFKDSLLFAFCLSLIGLGVVFAGMWWNKHGSALGARWRQQLSPQLAQLIEKRGA